MSGFEYAFVYEVPREYFCPICDCPMREPVQTKCGHRFCKHCLEQSMKRKRKCPIDRQALDQHSAKDIYPDVAIQRTILDFVVKCPYECNGCKWTAELRSIETHESSCSFVGVKCTNKGCDATPLKKNLHNHVTNECPKRKVECLYCKAASFIWYTRQGHFDVCKKYPMECRQKCGEQIPRDKMSDHVDKSCPHTTVECTYACVGCKVKVKRRAIADHVKRNTESHLMLACERLKELQVSSTLTTASIKHEIVTATKKINELSEAVLNSGDLQELRNKVTTTLLSSLTADVDTIKPKMEELMENMSSNDETLSELEDEVNELQELIPRVDSLQGLREEVWTVNTNLQKLKEAFTRFDKTNSSRNRQVFCEIDDAKWQLRSQFQAELQDIREDAEKNRKLLAQREAQLRDVIISIFCIAIFVLCVRYGVFTDLNLPILRNF